VQQLTIEEAEKYGKTFDHAGCSITVTGRTTKDFTGIDPVLDEMYSDMERLKARIKAREATIEAGMNPETGEMFAPVKKSVTTFLTYKFK
jgi:ribosome-associated translation inhibitor RaiA